MKYILIVDEDEDILNIQQMVLSSFYGGKVISVNSGQEGYQAVEEYGEPEMIVADQRILEEPGPSIYPHLVEKDILVPLIVCSNNLTQEFNEKKFPHVSAFVQKPFGIESLSYLVKSITSEPLAKPEYVPVKLSILLNFIGKSFDLFLKLSETNYVKVFKQGDQFLRQDCDKLMQKGVTTLYISSLDIFDFLRCYEENLNMIVASKSVGDQKAVDVIDSLENIEALSRRMGWTPEIIEAARKCISSAVKILTNSSEISEILKMKLSNPAIPYARHIGVHAYLSCILSKDFGWGGDAVQTKLVLATILHDLAVDESYYQDIRSWNLKAANLRDRTPETIKYRLHPLEASRLLQTVENLPPDIEQIILQHHEKKDGTGFPRALVHNRISQLATFFIIVEDLVDFIGDGENLETSFTDFKTWGDSYYDCGHFQKIYHTIREKIK